MFISDEEKVFGTILNSFMITTLCKIGIEGTNKHLIKGI